MCVVCWVGDSNKEPSTRNFQPENKHFCFPEVSNVGSDKRKVLERLNGPGILNHPYFIKDCTNIFFRKIQCFTSFSIISQNLTFLSHKVLFNA